MDDLISRQDALDAFGLSEKTRKYGGDHSGYNTMMLYEIQDFLEGLPSVSVKQETPIDCSDSICRADAIKLVKSYIHEIITESGVDKNAHTNEILRDIVKSLAFEFPPVSTEKTGRWNTFELFQGGIKETWYECPKCKWSNALGIPRNYCPNCGARMQEETETCKDCTNKCIMYDPDMECCKDKMEGVEE